MNRIASELFRIASELVTRVKATYFKSGKTDEKRLSSVSNDIQRFVSTIGKNEEVEVFVTRKDTDRTMEIVVGFEDHEATDGIIDGLKDMMVKLGKKNRMRVETETSF